MLLRKLDNYEDILARANPCISTFGPTKERNLLHKKIIKQKVIKNILHVILVGWDVDNPSH